MLHALENVARSKIIQVREFDPDDSAALVEEAARTETKLSGGRYRSLK